METRLLFILALFFSAYPCYAENGVTIEPYINDGILVIEKTAPEEITLGDVAEITITIKNGFKGETDVELLENLGGMNVVDYGPFKGNREGYSVVPDMEQSRAVIKAGANSKTTVVYKIKPETLGELVVPATSIRTPLERTESPALTINVRCVPDGLCDLAGGEDSMNCPEDCKPQNQDKICNPENDGVCDPDCRQKVDPDCQEAENKTTDTTFMPLSPCGNNLCDNTENYDTCPGDCPSGAKDGYCDKVKDGRCDADCKSNEDPDCSGDASWLVLLALIIIIGIVVAATYGKKWLKPGE